MVHGFRTLRSSSMSSPGYDALCCVHSTTSRPLRDAMHVYPMGYTSRCRPTDGAVHVYPMGYTSSWCCACIPPGVYIQMVLCMCTCTCTCAVPTSAHVQIRVFRGVHLLSTPKCLKGSHRVFTCLNTTVPERFWRICACLWGVAYMHIMCYASHDVHVFDRY